MQSTYLGKTILVWNRLSDSEISRIIDSLTKTIEDYRKRTNGLGFSKPIPIPLYNDNTYLSIIIKHDEIFVSTTRNDKKWDFNPIINCDELYKSIELIEEYDINKYISICEKYPDTNWVKLPYNKTFEDYAMTPNINPQDFIKHLQSNSLSEFQKHFLTQVGISLDSPQYSSDLQNTINKANEIFERD